MEGIEINDENTTNIESELMKQQDETSVVSSENTSDISVNDSVENVLENVKEDDFDEFKENAISYFTLDDEISTLNKKLRELRKQKNDCTKNLIEFMGDNKIKDINTDSGKLK